MVARIVSEAGLVFVQVCIPIYRPWYLLPVTPTPAAVKSFFHAALLTSIFAQDQRESLSGFASQTLRTLDGAVSQSAPPGRPVWPCILCLVAALTAGYVIAGTSTLFVEYSHAVTLDERQVSPINSHGVEVTPKRHTMDPVHEFRRGSSKQATRIHWLHVGIGFAISGLLGVLRLRYLSWPFHPVGYLLVYTYPIQRIWFSIFLGWLAKVLILRFGGASLFHRSRNLFIGFILGEASAAGFWLIVSLARNSLGLTYKAINILPT